MNTRNMLIVAGGLALAALPSALAGDAGEKLKQMDIDKDGRISRTEYTAAEQANFARLDVNSDGIINATELAAALEPKKKNPLKFWVKDDKAAPDKSDGGASLSPTGRLSAADQNSDGQITRTEHEAQAEATFTALDTDKDGSLTEQELGAGEKPAMPAK